MDVVIFIAVILVVAVVYAAVVWVARRIVRHHVREGHNDVLAPLFLTAGTLYAVLLAFLTITVWEAHNAANENAAEEASTLATMYRQTAGMPADEQREMRELIRAYTEAVVKDEWAIQAASGGASPKARHLVAEIYRKIGTLPPNQASSAITVEFLKTFSTVAADRNRRTLQANEDLPFVLWVGLLVGGAIVVGMTFLLYMEVFWLHALMSGLCALLIGTLLIITFLMDQPFRGPLALDAGAFEHSMNVYKSVDQGN